jgi:hypothetical protein
MLNRVIVSFGGYRARQLGATRVETIRGPSGRPHSLAGIQKPWEEDPLLSVDSTGRKYKYLAQAI